MSKLFSVLRKLFSLLFAALFWFTGVLSSAPSVTKGELMLEKEFAYPFTDGAAFCQGITTDGTDFYATGCLKYLNYNAIVKIDAETGEILQCNDMCLPPDVMKKGYSHLGDCSYADGRIYAACEAFLFKDPAVMVFDAETLGFLEYHVLPAEGQGNGHLPWVCVSGDTLYYTQAREVDEVRMLRLSDFSWLGALPLDRTLTKISGGAVLGNTLYLASDEGKAEKTTWAVDLSTGKTTVGIVRAMGNDFTEAEGLAIGEMDGNPYFCYLDFILPARTMIRTYSMQK